jgi:hypothetical protein
MAKRRAGQPPRKFAIKYRRFSGFPNLPDAEWGASFGKPKGVHGPRESATDAGELTQRPNLWRRLRRH